MQLQISKVLLCSIVVCVAFGLVACTPPTPEEQVAASRAQYKVTLNAFVPQDPPVEETAPELIGGGEDGIELVDMEVAGVVGEEGADGEAVAAAAADETGEEVIEDAGPATRDILFDLVVIFDGSDPLPGLTLDVSQADPFEKEKATFRHYIELDPMVKSETKQVSFILEGIENYEEGDLFSVNLREYVAPEDRGEYREFVEAK